MKGKLDYNKLFNSKENELNVFGKKINSNKIIYIKEYILFLFITFIFYKNIYISILLSFISIPYSKLREKEVKQNMNEVNSSKFKDFLYGFSVALSTGESVPNAIIASYEEMKNLYNENDYMMKQISNIIEMQALGSHVEELFLNFAKETKLQDIKRFAEVFCICNSSGGNLASVIRQTMDIMDQRNELNNEIKTIFASKKYEMKIITILPILLFFVISQSAKEYVEVLYQSMLGYIVISIALILILVADIISKRIMDVR